MTEDEGEEIADWVKSGLSYDHATAYAVLSSNAGEAVFSPRFAATAFAMYDAMAAVIRQPRASAVSPPVYSGLSGQYGLLECPWEQDGWRNLTVEPRVGMRFVTSGTSCFRAACEHIFPDGKYDGIYDMFEDEDEQALVQRRLSTDVVCIRCAAPSSVGRHNLFKEIVKGTRQDRESWVLPPFAVVTLVSIQHKWRVRRQTMRCRLFTCEVTFDMW